MCLFTGLYRPSGKPFIDHVVGTASILGSLHAPAKLVAGGLAHAAYNHGDFGGWKKGMSTAKREQVGDAVGKEVEEYIARYTRLRWNRRTIPAIYDEFQTFGPIDRDVLLMRLANELEDLQELDVLYCFHAEGRRRHTMRFGPLMIDMAQKLGRAPLSAELERVLRETATGEIPVQLRCRHKGVALIAPKSYRRQAPVAVNRSECLKFIVYS